MIRCKLAHQPEGVNFLRMPVRVEIATIEPRARIANDTLNHRNDGIDAHFA